MAASAFTGCVMDDLPECPNEYALKIRFDRNMLYADAFATQVKSIDVKVFDFDSGKQVYHFSDEGPGLADESYLVSLPIPPGKYNILCWAGMAAGDSFGYTTRAGDELPEFSVILNDGAPESVKRLDNLFHGLLTGVEFTDNNAAGSFEPQIVTMPLTKDTNNINVMLHNLNGTPMDPDGYEMRISATNAEMDFRNSTAPSRRVRYSPWHVTPVSHVKPGISGESTVQSALAAEFSMSRLMVPDKEAGISGSRLEVVRKTDGVTIISIPLESNLLLYRGQFHSQMTPQEFLDRQDDYQITFILDVNNSWDRSAMIYINDWATPPIQYQEW